ncbi:MAG: murein L,D-transpeptidase catalytic domain family protein [Verrucomicrobiales bacterium]|nr:murein L,D-transpeptidase catalytic domain family protein [Verrucomicrobiales bacterium]
MAPSRNNPIERTMMAIPATIVIAILGVTALRLAGENLVSSLSTVTVNIPEIGSAPRETKILTYFESDLMFEEPVDEMIETNVVPTLPPAKEPAVEEISITETKWISGPILSSKERDAKKLLESHLGGQKKLHSEEIDMNGAFSAAERALLRKGIDIDKLDVIGVVDMTKPSYARRMSLYHPKNGKETRHLVSHGTNTGGLYATEFSNRVGSHQTSPGLYLVGEHYSGSHGKSLRLHGLEDSNDQAFRRAIVLHSAWYVSYSAIENNLNKEGVPRIGRSHGCPAVHEEELEFILDKLEPDTYLYIHAES